MRIKLGDCIALVALLLAACCSRQACGGGGPENVALVVNSASWSSLTVANYYARLRAIPPSNIIHLEWRGGSDQIDGEPFRRQILGPVLAELDRRGIGEQIDYVVYSSDFPHAVNLGGDFAGAQIPPQINPILSINSATFFWQSVMAGNPAALGLRNNQYMRAAAGRSVDRETSGFHAWYGWGPKGELLEAGGQKYLLSTVLAATSGRGNSVSEAIAQLTQSAAADGTQPRGTIYFCRNDDIRAKTRQPGFEAAVEELGRLGVKAEILDAQLPTNKADVAGTMVGLADFNWPATGSTILPGAICEHLTSFGGILAEGHSQAPLTEWLRRGAAGSCGTVVEPFALQDKFPVPAVHVHYARGCTLAEAIYQSVYGPFQLLIVGDPLCRPWAKIPRVEADGIKAGGTVSGKIAISPRAKAAEGVEIDRFELFVDGRRRGRVAPGGAFGLDTADVGDGYHEVRIVAIERSDIESQGRLIVPLLVDNRGGKIEFPAPRPAQIALGRQVRVTVASPGAKAIVVAAGVRVMGRIEGERGELEIDTRALGNGPVTLQAVATRGESAREVVASPVQITVTASPLSPLADPPVGQLLNGLALTTAEGKVVPVQSTRESNWLGKAGVQPGEKFSLEAFFDVGKTDGYQFQISHRGALRVRVGEETVYDEAAGKFDTRYAPVALAKGLHHLRIDGTCGELLDLRLQFGGPGCTSLAGDVFRHPQ